MTEPTIQQIVIAKTPAEIEAERQAEITVALQRKIAAEILILEQVEDGDNDDARHRNDYTYTVRVNGQTWVATWDSTSRSYLQRDSHSHPPRRILPIPSSVLQDANPEAPYLDNTYTAINVTDLFNGRRQEISSVIMSLSKASDADADFTLSVIMQHGEYEVSWPESDATSGAISMADLFILVTKEKTNGTVMIATGEGAIGKLMGVKYHPEDMFSPEHITWTMEASMIQGNKMKSFMRRGGTASQKMFGADLAIRPATEAQIADAVTKGRAAAQKLITPEGFAHLQYRSVAFTPGWFGSRVPHLVDSRVVVDPDGLRLMDQSMLSRLLQLTGAEAKEDREYRGVDVADPQDSDYACMIHMAVFYNLSNGAWMLGHTDGLDNIKFRNDAFDRLVLDEQRKRMVNALVVHHGANRDGTPDIIDGKGGGCIFLLDGPPGTGKTLTAEATAEKLERVLYKVGLGELGVEAQSLEERLQQILSTAARWNAVLLLDEADVFLEKRSTENLERNAMVAVFLRLLEYYNGILFLTTNRGDNFDPAVISRITLALHFRAPDDAGRSTIWTNLLANAGIKVSEKELRTLAGLQVNGREIKNAINSSRALAAGDGIEVNYQHIREIIDASTRFAEEVLHKKG